MSKVVLSLFLSIICYSLPFFLTPNVCMIIFVQGFQLAHSLGGGTGSGLGTLLISKVAIDSLVGVGSLAMLIFSNITIALSDNRRVPGPYHSHLFGLAITQGKIVPRISFHPRS